MTSTYEYKGIDITLDIYDKIQAIAEKFAASDGISFDEAYEKFAQSKTYKALTNPRTLMWSESVPFIMEEFENEMHIHKQRKYTAEKSPVYSVIVETIWTRIQTQTTQCYHRSIEGLVNATHKKSYRYCHPCHHRKIFSMSVLVDFLLILHIPRYSFESLFEFLTK